MALALVFAFIGLAVIGRMLIQYYFTGDHGVRFASLKGPLMESVPGTLFVISFIVSLLLVAMHTTAYLDTPDIESTSIRAGFFLIGLIGIGITVIAQWQMGIAWRIGVDQSETTALITRGLYRRSRNPIYFGIFLYWIGMAVTLPHPGIWACAIVCWLSIELIVRQVEEPYLERVHRTAYEAYRRTTNRYLIW